MITMMYPVTFSMAASEPPADINDDQESRESCCATIVRLAYQLFANIVYYFTLTCIDLPGRVSKVSEEEEESEGVDIRGQVPTIVNLLEAVSFSKLNGHLQQIEKRVIAENEEMMLAIDVLNAELEALASVGKETLISPTKDEPDPAEIEHSHLYIDVFATFNKYPRVIKVLTHLRGDTLQEVSDRELDLFSQEAKRAVYALLAYKGEAFWGDKEGMEKVTKAHTLDKKSLALFQGQVTEGIQNHSQLRSKIAGAKASVRQALDA